MEVKKRHLIAAFLLGASISTLFGFVSSYSNLYGSYPSFASKAYRPSKPFSKDEYSISRYRQQVEQYRDDCESYIQAANNDIATIRREIQRAIDETNAVVSQYNSFIRFGF
jgi:hypothetical protein